MNGGAGEDQIFGERGKRDRLYGSVGVRDICGDPQGETTFTRDCETLVGALTPQ